MERSVTVVTLSESLIGCSQKGHFLNVELFRKKSNIKLRTSNIKLLVIVGPTASGKSDLALKIAKRFNGEIICADSRTIYRGMDVGTAKPTPADKQKIPHFGLDLVEPGQSFSAYKFKTYAEQKITDIARRGKLPILVGGTGLYIDATLFNFTFRPSNKLDDRPIYLKKTVGELQEIAIKRGYKMPENKQNKRHLIRTIEAKGQLGSKEPGLNSHIIVIGLMPSEGKLKINIEARLKKSFQGLVSETARLIEKNGRDKLLKTAGIPYIASTWFIDGEVDEVGAKEIIKKSEWQYARRQRTWFRRNPYIKWFDSPEAAYSYIKEVL